MRRRLASLIPAAVAALSLAGVALAAAIPAYVAHAVADSSRPKADVEADSLRKPAETLAFAGVKPGMWVIELFPGGGYYTRMLADVVGAKGRVFAVENAGWKGAVKADQEMLAQLNRPNVTVDVEPFGQLKLERGAADLFWITQNYHDLKIAKYGVVDTGAFNREVFAALKPGGVYLIVDHEANPGVTEAQIADLHRIEKATVIREVTAAGFKLVDEGRFLRHSTDDHTKAIFDKAVQGQTDQYALKFIKPKA
jgi:predicted methyltransferase